MLQPDSIDYCCICLIENSSEARIVVKCKQCNEGHICRDCILSLGRMPECPVCRLKTRDNQKWYTVVKHCSPITEQNNIVFVIERRNQTPNIVINNTIEREISHFSTSTNTNTNTITSRNNPRSICIHIMCRGIITIYILIVTFLFGWMFNLMVFGEDFVFRAGLSRSEVLIIVGQSIFVGFFLVCFVSAGLTSCMCEEMRHNIDTAILGQPNQPERLPATPAPSTPTTITTTTPERFIDYDEELADAVQPSILAMQTHHNNTQIQS